MQYHAARYTHLTARTSKKSDDKKIDSPLHTHRVITNATKCAEKEWYIIVFDKLYENKVNLGELYGWDSFYRIFLLNH